MCVCFCWVIVTCVGTCVSYQTQRLSHRHHIFVPAKHTGFTSRGGQRVLSACCVGQPQQAHESYGWVLLCSSIWMSFSNRRRGTPNRDACSGWSYWLLCPNYCSYGYVLLCTGAWRVPRLSPTAVGYRLAWMPVLAMLA